MPVWDELLTERDRKVIEGSGFGSRRGFGQRPALFIVDMQVNFVGLKADVLTSVAEYPTSVGEDAWKAVAHTQRVLATARKQGIPVFYSTSGRLPNETQFDTFRKKRKPGSAAGQFGSMVEELAPLPEEVVIEKRFASAFLGTPLLSFLTSLHIDTLVFCGLTTSGCLRATVVDAASYNFHVSVVGEGCADRLEISHKVGLLDMNMKYGDVISTQEAVDYMVSVPHQ